MTALSPRDGYRLWAPTYSAETAVTALETETVASFAIPVAGRRLLDAACGTGRRLRSANAGLSIGIDLTPEMLPALHGPEQYAVADLRALPLRSAYFDVVWCRLALGHVAELCAAYSELARVCRSGGCVVITDFHAQAAKAGHRRTFRDVEGFVHEIEHHVHSFDDHMHAGEAAGLAPWQHDERTIGPSIREFYERAGRLGAYEEQFGLPLVLGIAFSRRH